MVKVGKRMADETNLFQHLPRIFGVSHAHHTRTENGWEQDGKMLQRDWEQVGRYFQKEEQETRR